MTDVYLLYLYNENAFSYSTTINNVAVSISIVKNTRTSRYHFTVTLKDGTKVIDGMKMVMGNEMFTSASFEAGLVGYFLLTPINDTIQESDETMSRIADNFAFGFIS